MNDPALSACEFCRESALRYEATDFGSYLSCPRCGAYFEERMPKFDRMFLQEVADVPLEVVTADVLRSNEFRESELPDDPLASAHFVTGFSRMDVHDVAVDVAFARTLAPDVGNLHHMLLPELQQHNGDDLSRRLLGVTTVEELAARLGQRQFVERAVRIMQKHLDSVRGQPANVEGVAVAAFAVASSTSEGELPIALEDLCRTAEETCVSPISVSQNEVRALVRVLQTLVARDGWIRLPDPLAFALERFLNDLRLATDRTCSETALHVANELVRHGHGRAFEAETLALVAVFVASSALSLRLKLDEIAQTLSARAGPAHKLVQEIRRTWKLLLPPEVAASVGAGPLDSRAEPEAPAPLHKIFVPFVPPGFRSVASASHQLVPEQCALDGRRVVFTGAPKQPGEFATAQLRTPVKRTLVQRRVEAAAESKHEAVAAKTREPSQRPQQPLPQPPPSTPEQFVQQLHQQQQQQQQQQHHQQPSRAATKTPEGPYATLPLAPYPTPPLVYAFARQLDPFPSFTPFPLSPSDTRMLMLVPPLHPFPTAASAAARTAPQ